MNYLQIISEILQLIAFLLLADFRLFKDLWLQWNGRLDNYGRSRYPLGTYDIKIKPVIAMTLFFIGSILSILSYAI